MKKILLILGLPLCFIACNSSSSGTAETAAPAKDSVAAAPVNLPYTAIYSSNFVPGKPSDVEMVLRNYKDWETGDLKDMAATFGDTLEMIFSSGNQMRGHTDSLMKLAQQFRDSLSSVKLMFYAWTSNHSVDKNENWVNVWYKEIDTYKTGKVDSAFYQDDNRLNSDGKIVWVSSHKQDYLKPKKK